jgi:hypothetical protein
LVDLENEGRGEGIEGFGAVELDLELLVKLFRWSDVSCSDVILTRIERDLLKPTPGFGVETSRYSNVFWVEYPLASLGRPVDWN